MSNFQIGFLCILNFWHFEFLTFWLNQTIWLLEFLMLSKIPLYAIWILGFWHLIQSNSASRSLISPFEWIKNSKIQRNEKVKQSKNQAIKFLDSIKKSTSQKVKNSKLKSQNSQFKTQTQNSKIKEQSSKLLETRGDKGEQRETKGDEGKRGEPLNFSFSSSNQICWFNQKVK